jgi:hypothetical protein
VAERLGPEVGMVTEAVIVPSPVGLGIAGIIQVVTEGTGGCAGSLRIT